MDSSTQDVSLTNCLILEIVNSGLFDDRRFDAQKHDSFDAVLLTGLWMRNETL